MDLLTYYSDLAVAYPEYITQKQFCEVCGICHKTAYNLTRRGEISYDYRLLGKQAVAVG